MTKKDYVRAAAIIAEVGSPDCRSMLSGKFADFFASDNPRFDRDRFLAACTPVSQPVARKRSRTGQAVSNGNAKP